MTCQTLPWNSDDAPLESKKLDSEVPCEIVPSCVCYNFKSLFFCGQGTDNVQPWVPYHIRVRDFFERWPGAMKASHVKCSFQRLCFFLAGKALPPCPEESEALLDASQVLLSDKDFSPCCFFHYPALAG